MSDFVFYFRLLSRRFPALAALILLCSCIGAVVALRLPTTYSTSATLLVEASQIPNELVRATVQVDATEQLEVIQQRLMTRSNLLAVARDNRVFPRQTTLNPDDVVAEMRQRTSIRRTSGRNKATLMVIGFTGPNPNQVAAVVNQYVTIVLEANSDFRTARAEGTLEFFQQEVETLSKNLDEQSAKIVAFKNEHADALPENLEYRMGRQALLQERLSRAERDLEALNGQRANIERVYRTTGAIETPNKVQLSPEQARLRDLESQLRAALSVYSESSPKVTLLRSQMAALEAQMTPADAAPEDGEPVSPSLSALETSLADIDGRIEALKAEISNTNAELAKLSDSIDRTPANRITLDALDRDLTNTQTLYSAAVQRLSQARMGERIELSSKGERITVLEPASVPTSPSGPNRLAIAGIGVGAGLSLAALLFVMLELLNQTIRRPIEIQRSLDITPLVTVPRFETLAGRRRRRLLQLVTLGIVIVAVPAALWAVDTYYMPLDELFTRIKARLT